jgi:cytochrome P450
MFLFAGYETTTNTLAFLVYFLSTNPEAQRKLHQEVDKVLGERPATLDDAPKVSHVTHHAHMSQHTMCQ